MLPYQLVIPMPILKPIPPRADATPGPSLATRLNTWMLALIWGLAFAAFTSPVAAQKLAQAEANSIKRYQFSTDTFEAVKAEFKKREVVFADALKEPAPGRTTWSTGTGSSGYPTPYAIDHVRGHFHVYGERRRPQNPVAPLPYVTQDVVFETPDPGVAPVGTLSYPESGRDFPAVVLVAGTGPHDRDDGMSLHKTLLVLADHLTRQGFAVLRYDKRGVGLTGGQRHPGSTTDDYVTDALAAVRFLQMQPNIDPRRIGIAGHSEGGIIAAMAAAKAPDEVAFIVMLAGTGLPGIDVKSLQDAAARRADGMPESLVSLNRSQERELYVIAASKLDHRQALAAMGAATDALPAAEKATLGIPAEGIPAEAYEDLLSPWFRRFLALDPRAYLEKVRCPVLALNGGKDLQVTPTENLAGIKSALARGANRHATVLRLPGINHNLQTARTGKPSEYFEIDETVAPLVLARMTSWMQDVVGLPLPPAQAERDMQRALSGTRPSPSENCHRNGCGRPDAKRRMGRSGSSQLPSTLSKRRKGYVS